MSPLVSVIIPCRNEEKTIHRVLEALHQQSFPVEDMEVVIADGLSEDNTRSAIQAFQEAHPRLKVRLVDNPKRIIPAGLNTAIKAAQGEIIVRMDAHSLPEPDYVQRSVDAVQSGIAENVGGVWNIQAPNESWIARSIAAAAGNPLAVGDALYRFTDKAAYVDTVPYGAYKSSLFDEIGCSTKRFWLMKIMRSTPVSGRRAVASGLTPPFAAPISPAQRCVPWPNNIGAMAIGKLKC